MAVCINHLSCPFCGRRGQWEYLSASHQLTCGYCFEQSALTRVMQFTANQKAKRHARNYGMRQGRLDIMNHDDVDRSDLIDPNGKYAIVRPDSQSGHSPSTRYKTKKNAEIAATRLLENMTHPGTFEVVRIVSRVTTQNIVRVINVK